MHEENLKDTAHSKTKPDEGMLQIVDFEYRPFSYIDLLFEIGLKSLHGNEVRGEDLQEHHNKLLAKAADEKCNGDAVYASEIINQFKYGVKQ